MTEDCGVNGCAREVGHIGIHRRDPAMRMSMSVRPKAALRTALLLIFQVVRHPRTGVTVDVETEWKVVNTP